MSSRRQAGFTLVELMIVLVIIGIVAGFAIPSFLESQKSGHESSAEKSLKTILDAEATFLKSDYDQAANPGRNFAYNLANLRDTLDAAGGPINLIDVLLAAGAKENYVFGTIPTYNAAGASDFRHGFAYYAVPAVYPDSGRKTYVLNSEGVLYYKDQGAATVPAAWPDPANDATWTEVGS